MQGVEVSWKFILRVVCNFFNQCSAEMMAPIAKGLSTGKRVQIANGKFKVLKVVINIKEINRNKIGPIIEVTVPDHSIFVKSCSWHIPIMWSSDRCSILTSYSWKLLCKWILHSMFNRKFSFKKELVLELIRQIYIVMYWILTSKEYRYFIMSINNQV